MLRKLLYLLVTVVVLIPVTFFIYKYFFQNGAKQDESNQSAIGVSSEIAISTFGNIIAPKGEPEPVYEDNDGNQYKFDPSYKYNIEGMVNVVLKSVGGEKVTVEINGIEQSHQYDSANGFLVFCLPESYVAPDGTVIKNSEIMLVFSQATDEDKMSMRKKSMNLSVNKKVEFLNKFFIGKTVQIGTKLGDPYTIESLNVYAQEDSLCRWSGRNE